MRNNYDLKLFDEVLFKNFNKLREIGGGEVPKKKILMKNFQIRRVKSVGVWPVGLVGGLMVEKPICADGKVTGFQANYFFNSKIVNLQEYTDILNSLKGPSDEPRSY